MLEIGAHYGHQSRRWNPKMDPYLYSTEGGVHVFDLTITKTHLEEALNFLTESASEGKKILIVGTKRQASEKVEAVAKSTGSFYVNERWLGGTLTNFEQIQKSLKKLDEMKEDKASGKQSKFTKKERLLMDREIERLERFFGGIVGMTDYPDVMFVVDVKREAGAVKEGNAKNVEVIGIVDSNSDPDGVDYIIPMNDDAVNAVDYVLDLVEEAILKGQKKGEKKTENKAKKKTK